MSHLNEFDACNPNVLFDECLKLVSLANQQTAAAIESRNTVRSSLFRVGQLYQRLAHDHHEWLVAQAASVGGIDALLDGWFKSLGFFGEDWRDLLRDIAAGATERDYLASSAGSFLRRKRIARMASKSPDPPPAPPPADDSAPIEKRLEAAQERSRVLDEQLASARKEVNALRIIAARQERRIAELEAVIATIEKTTHRLKVG